MEKKTYVRRLPTSSSVQAWVRSVTKQLAAKLPTPPSYRAKPAKTRLKLYANGISQPSRAIMWLLKIKDVDYEFIDVEFGGPVFTSNEFLALNPNGFIPVIEDGDFSLYEGNAILTYLAEKYGWEELYPTKDLETLAKINEYLHWHHTNARLFTTKVMRPVFKRAIGVATPEDLANIEKMDEQIEKTTALVEAFLVNDFVARTNTATIADVALYCEYDQLEAMGLLDLTKFPRTQAWMTRMKQLPYHDEIREPMNAFLAKVGIKGQAEP